MTDILIIGGGIAGISAAARLAPHAAVTVLEAEANLAHHASGRSAAMYEPRYGLPPVVALSMASGDYFRSIPNLLTPRGLLIIGRAHEGAQFEADAEEMRLDRISPDEALSRVPILNRQAMGFAAYSDEAWDIDTDLLLQGFARQARGHGASILTSARVSAIRREAGRWVVTHPGGEVRADLLVNAAGAWVDQVADMAGVGRIGFTPLRRSMARLPAPGGHDVSRWPMIFGTGETWYAKPDAGALIVSPAEEDPMAPQDAWADDMVLAEGLARYEEMVTEPVTRLMSNWAGLRTFSPDRVPVIGRDTREPSFFWLAGQGGYGFQSSDGASRLAAALALGLDPGFDAGLVAALSPARFG